MQRDAAARKMESMIHQIRKAGSLLVAFSGGVDSSFLLAVAHETIGDCAVAATATSDIYPARERDAAIEFTAGKGIEHVLFQSEELSLPAFSSNGPDRCYHCKRSLFEKLAVIAREKGIRQIAHGANVDDLKDYRPGFQAASEMGIVAPLLDAGLKKKDIRLLSKVKGISHWDKPAQACLATRIPYGDRITIEKLKKIDASETFLFSRGFRQCRVRIHGDVARIELKEAEFNRLMDDELRRSIVCKFKEIGFLNISLDLEGYISGSMNRMLKTD